MAAQKVARKQFYRFPKCSLESIAKDLTSLGMTVQRDPRSEARDELTQKDLENPCPMIIHSLFKQILECVMGAAYQDVCAPPPFEALQKLPNPQLYEFAMVEIPLLQRMLRLMESINCPATVRDFAVPQKERLRMMLSGVINFVRYCQEQGATFDELSKESRELGQQKAALVEEYLKAVKQVKNLRARREAALPQIQELQDNIGELEKEIASLRKQERDVENEAAAANKAIQETEESMENDRLSLAHVRESVKRLESQVVRNPAELKRSLHEMNLRIGAEKEEIAAASQRLLALQAHRKMTQRLQQRIEVLTAQMAEIQRIMQETAAAQREAQEAKQRIALVVQDTKSQKAMQEDLNHQIDSSQKKLYELKQQFERKRQEGDQALDKLRQAKLQRQLVATRHGTAADQNDALGDNMEQEIADLQRDHQEYMRTLNESFSRLNIALKRYHDRIHVNLR